LEIYIFGWGPLVVFGIDRVLFYLSDWMDCALTYELIISSFDNPFHGRSVLLTSFFGALFMNSILKNYSFKKSNSLIFNLLNARIFITTYHLRFLKRTSWTIFNHLK
jgi:hypothetical protein